jgi:hypothetical protein
MAQIFAEMGGFVKYTVICIDSIYQKITSQKIFNAQINKILEEKKINIYSLHLFKEDRSKFLVGWEDKFLLFELYR